jgi:Tfp pilus assembly protein PilF
MLWTLGLAGWIALMGSAARHTAAESPLPGSMAPAPRPTLTDSMKGGMGRIARALEPKAFVKSAPDPVALSSPGKPSAELFVAVARMHERSGKFAEAARHYELALQHTPDYLGALLGYARLKDRTGNSEAAMALYRTAAKAHPNEPSAHNNLALFHARHGRLQESVVSLERAVALDPKSVKYRNNVATVLAEIGRNRDAYEHLCAVHGEAAAYYNLGYLLEKKSQFQAAAQHYAKALQLNPSLDAAKQKLVAMRQNIRPPAAPAILQPEVRLGDRSALPRAPTPPSTAPLPPSAGARPRGHLPSVVPEPNVRPLSTVPSHPAPIMAAEPSQFRRLPAAGAAAEFAPAAPMPPSVPRWSTATAPLPPRAANAPIIQPLPRRQ